MQADLSGAVCICCGVRYSTVSLRTKIQEIRGTVQVEGEVKASQTGTSADIEQWKALMDTYIKAGDFTSVETTCKKILDAAPDDAYANEIYQKVQSWKFFEIRNGVLVHYNGKEENVIIPEGVKIIGNLAFSVISHVGRYDENYYLKSVTLPNTVEEIGEQAFWHCPSLRQIQWGDNVRVIGRAAFLETALEEVVIPNSVQKIGEYAFSQCRKLKSIELPRNYSPQCSILGSYRFLGSVSCESLESVFYNGDIKSALTIMSMVGDEKYETGGVEWRFYYNGKELKEIAILDDYPEKLNFSKCLSLESIMIVGKHEVNCCSCKNLSKVLFSKTARYSFTRTSNFGGKEETYDYFDTYFNRSFKGTMIVKQPVCPHCGGTYNGIFNKKCSKCGKPMNYEWEAYVAKT